VKSDLLLHKLLEAAGGPAERGYVLALDGEGLEDVPDRIDTSRASYTVYRPQTELEVRRILWKTQGAPFIALLKDDLARRLPPDLVRRAQGCRVHALDANSILGVALGVPVLGTEDRAVLQLALDNIDGLTGAIRKRTLPTMIDRQLLDELLVDVCTDTRVRADKPGALLAQWIEQPPTWPLPVRDLVCRTLPRLHAHEGKVLAWGLQGGKTDRLQGIVVRGTLLELVDEPPEDLWGELNDARIGMSLELTDDILALTVVSLTREALEELSERTSGELLAKAEGLGRRLLPKSTLARSTILPLGLENRCAEIAKQASRGEPVPASAFEAIRAHRSAKLKASEIELLEEMARLSRYLGTDDPEAKTTADHVQGYLRKGAFADLAALRLKRLLASTDVHHDPAAKVLKAWRERRDQENQAFASLLRSGYAQALHSEGVTPLHRVWKDVALKGQAQDSPASVFLVVLDGCSYPVFIELLWSLSQRADSPVGLALDDSGVASGMPALAPLPTITSHARGALFLGAIPHDPWLAESRWKGEAEVVTDPARFRNNEILGSRTRRLFLKGDLSDGGQELRRTLADKSVEIVAAVFNAVDDQIASSNTGAVIRVRPDDVIGLVPSIKAALTAERKVLVTADHGHTPFLTKELRVAKGATPRYVVLGPNDAPPEGFCEIDVGDLGGEPGRKAFAYKIGVYQGLPQVGFHGGCGLEEMVVPLAWLVPKGVHANEPSWWFGAVSEAKPAEHPKQAKRPSKRPAKPAKPDTPKPPQVRIQTDLFDARMTVEARASLIERIGLPEKALTALDIVERAALVVLQENGTAATGDLATALGRPVQRVDGMMTQLHRKLHRAKSVRFQREQLPSGEVQYLYVGPTGGPTS
jgi:hypothetical protein